MNGTYGKFVLANAPGHEIIEVEAEEIKNVIGGGDESLLSSICSMLCTRPTCIGFSSNAQDSYKCNLYSKVVFAKSDPGIAKLDIKDKLYLR